MDKYMKAIEEARRRIERSRRIREDVNRQFGDELSYEDLMRLYHEAYNMCAGIKIVAVADSEVGKDFDEILNACSAIYDPIYEALQIMNKALEEVQHEADE